MRDGMIILKTYTMELEAEADKGLLEAMGLTPIVETDNCGGMRPHFDLTVGVRLMVPAIEAVQARELLLGQAENAVTEPWTCDNCGETIDAGFDTCWQCGRRLE